MKVLELLNDIEQIMRYRGLPLPERMQLLQWMSMELNELTGKYEFDWTATRMDPVIQTLESKRNYQLPEGFPENFLRGAGTDRGDEYACYIDDGSTDGVPLIYETPAIFFSRNLRGESDSIPSHYTILSLPDGRREIWLSPPPDSNSDSQYGIQGVFERTDWKLEEKDALPPLPGNSAALEYAVLRRCSADFEGKYQQSIADLAVRAAKTRQSRIIPYLGRYSQDEYNLMNRTGA